MSRKLFLMSRSVLGVQEIVPDVQEIVPGVQVWFWCPGHCSGVQRWATTELHALVSAT